MSDGSDYPDDNRSLKPEDIQALAQAFAKLATKIRPIILGVSKSIGQFYLKYEKELEIIAKGISEVRQHFYIYNEFRENCTQHEIVPHESLYYLFRKSSDFFIRDRQAQDEFLRGNWLDLKSTLLEEYLELGVSVDRKKFFEEILKAHEAKLFQVCTRGAIIEIEGLAADFCKKYEEKDNINSRKNLIQNWEKRINDLDSSAIKSYFIFLAFENYIGNVYLSSNARNFQTNISDMDILLSRNFHAHGGLSLVSERQSLNSILFLHNIASYFSMLGELSEQNI